MLYHSKMVKDKWLLGKRDQEAGSASLTVGSVFNLRDEKNGYFQSIK